MSSDITYVLMDEGTAFTDGTSVVVVDESTATNFYETMESVGTLTGQR